MSSAVRQLNKKGGANKWKFQSFSERIKDIQINITSADFGICHEIENNESYFATAFKRQTEINATEAYLKFSREMYPLIGSLSMVLYNKSQIINVIYKYMQDTMSSAAEAILTLIPLLAKDLRQELEEFFPALIQLLIPFIDSKQPPVIELTFQCIAHLMKFLQKYALREFDSVYEMLSPLLGKGKKQKPYIRQFISEALSYILRKVKVEQLRDHFNLIFSSVVNEEASKWLEYADGVALLFSNTVNHINYSLHSCTFHFIQQLVQSSLEVTHDRVEEVMRATMYKIIRHVSKEKSHILFDCLLEMCPLHPERISGYLLPAAEFYNGFKVPSRLDVITCLEASSQSGMLSSNYVKLLSNLIAHASPDEIQKCIPFFQKLHSDKSHFSLAHFIFFHKNLVQLGFPLYSTIFLPLAMKFIHAKSLSILDPQILQFISEILNSEKLSLNMSAALFANATEFDTFVARPCIEYLQSYEYSKKNRILLSAVLSILPKVTLSQSSIQPYIFLLLQKNKEDRHIFSLVLKTSIDYLSEPLEFKKIGDIVSKVNIIECPFLLEAISSLLLRYESISKHEKTEWFEKLYSFVSSFQHSIRLPVLQTLAQFYPESAPLQICLELEKLPNSLESIRSKGILLKRLLVALNSEAHDIQQLACRYMFALLAENFSPLWNYLHESLSEFSSTFPNIFWDETQKLMLQFHHPNPFYSIIYDFTFDYHSDDAMESDENENLLALSSYLAQFYARPKERVDHWNIQSLLLQLLSKNPMASKKANAIIPFFLDFLDIEYRHFHPRLRIPSLSRTKDTDCMVLSLPYKNWKMIQEKYANVTPVLIEKKLCQFLEIFSQFKPENTVHSESLYYFYIELLASSDTRVQKLALKCIKTFAKPWFLPYYDLFCKLLEDASFSEELVKINVSSTTNAPTFAAKHQDQIIPFLLRILFGRLRVKNRHAASRKAKIFNFLATCENAHIVLFFELMCPLKRIPDAIDFDFFDKIETKSAIHFCQSLEDFIKHLQLKMEYVLIPALSVLTSMVCSISKILEQHKKENPTMNAKVVPNRKKKPTGQEYLKEILSNIQHEENDDKADLLMDLDAEFDDNAETGSEVEEEEIQAPRDLLVESTVKNDEKVMDLSEDDAELEVDGADEEESVNSGSSPYVLRRLRKLRTVVFHRLIQLFNLGITFDGSTFIHAIYAHAIVPRIPCMAQENSLHPTPTLLLLASWILHLDFSLQINLDDLLPVLIECLSGSNAVRGCILDILFKLLEQTPEALYSVSSALFHQFVNIIDSSMSPSDLRIFELVQKLAPKLEASEASLIAGVTLKVLNSKLSSRVKDGMLTILPTCIQFLDQKVVGTIFFATSKLFAILEKLESRHQLILITKEHCARMELSQTAELCERLNRVSKKRLGEELDYDAILQAFSDILDQGSDFTYLQWVPLLYNSLYYLQNADLSIRNSAYRCLAYFIQLTSRNVYLNAGIHQVIFPAIKHALKGCKNELARSEYVKVLGQCIQHLQEDPFKNLRLMLGKGQNDESSFIDNIYHLQVHRRTRAIMRLRNYVHSISIANLKNIIFPILLHFLEHSDYNLINECLLTFTEIATRLTWGSYYNILLDFFVRLTQSKSRAETKRNIRAILAWLAGFHFELKHSPQSNDLNLHPEAKIKEKNAIQKTASSIIEEPLGIDDEIPMDAEHESAPNGSMNIESKSKAPDQKLYSTSDHVVFREGFHSQAQIGDHDTRSKIILALTRKIIPKLLKYFVDKRDQNDSTKSSIRVPIALGVSRLISQLPSVHQNFQISRLLIQLCQMLRSRSKIMRYKARVTIIQIMEVVGSKFLCFLIMEMKTALKRGFELHVLAYSIHKVMRSIKLAPSTLEPCLSDLCLIVYEDIFGKVGQEKDEEGYIKRMAEMKTCKSYEIIQLMAEYGSKNGLFQLLDTLKRVFRSDPDDKTLQKVSKALKGLSHGLSSNRSLNLEDLIQTSTTMIRDNLSLEDGEDYGNRHCHSFVSFGLHLLRGCLDSKKLKLNDEKHKELLDSLPDLLFSAFSSESQPTAVSAGEVIEKLIKFKLPKLKVVLPNILKKAFYSLSQSQDERSRVHQISLKIILASLKYCEEVPFSQEQVHLLFETIKPELGTDRNQIVYLSMIQLIVKQKLLFNEVYDIIVEIAQTILTSYSSNARQLCSEIYLLFLLDYPLSAKRLDDHFSWMIKNLDYENETGRLSLLRFLQTLIKKLPESTIAKYGQMLIAGLISKLMDDSPQCKELAASILQGLLKVYPDIQRVCDMLHIWYKSPETMNIAAQVHGLLITENKDDLSLMEPLQSILMPIADSQNYDLTEENGSKKSITVDEWQILYFALLTFTKYLKKNQVRDMDVMKIISPHFSHPHHWVRLASSRCLGTYLSSNASMSVNSTAHTITAMIMQLQSPHLDEALSTQVVKNLFNLLQLQLRNISTSSSYSSNMIQRPIRYLSYLARKDQTLNKETLFRQSIFQVFAAVIHGFDASQLLPISEHMLASIYRTVQDESMKGENWVALRNFCNEILQLLESKIGPKQFGKVYSNVRSSTVSKRMARKQELTEMAVTQPSLHARILLLKKERIKKQKKRKIAEEMALKVPLVVKRHRSNSQFEQSGDEGILPNMSQA